MKGSLLLGAVAGALGQRAAAAGAAQPQGPCDIFGAAGTPCVAAHSLTRALYGAYSGALYQVQRASDNATRDVGLLSPGGIVDASIVTTFCAGASCVVLRIYDQSPQANHLDPGPAGTSYPHPDLPVNATRHPLTLSGHPAWAAHFEGRMGYRNDNTTGVATGNDPETLYMVTSGAVYNGRCCFDYGNAERDNRGEGPGTMESVYFGNSARWGHGTGSGPWIMADLEAGLWASNKTVNNQYASLNSTFVVGMVKGGTAGFAIKAGDATQQGGVATVYAGARPPGYQPMNKKGAIILGIGGDNSNLGIGVFFEGVITQGYSTDAVDEAVFANIVATGYGT